MSRIQARTLREIFKPWWMRWFAGPVTAIGVYDTLGGQFELPTLRKLIGVSGASLPWWGWLLVLQAFFVAGLFEYVRRNVPRSGSNSESSTVSDATLTMLQVKLAEIGEDQKAIISDYQRMSGLDAKLTERLNDQHSMLQEVKVSLEAHQLAIKFSILAIYHRERLLAIAREIETIAEDLQRRLAGGVSLSQSEWESWLANYQIWLLDTNRWSDFAVFYLGRDPNNEIQRLHPTDFEGEWSASHVQFPDPEDIRRYKEFCIFHRNWKDVSKVVHERVRMQAFEGKQTADREVIDEAVASSETH